MNKYRIIIDDDVVVVCQTGGGIVRESYFDPGSDDIGTAQELYNLLKSAGADVEMVL